MKKLIVFALLIILFSSCATLTRWKNEPLQRGEPVKWKVRTDKHREAGKKINPLYYPTKTQYIWR